MHTSDPVSLFADSQREGESLDSGNSVPGSLASVFFGEGWSQGILESPARVRLLLYTGKISCILDEPGHYMGIDAEIVDGADWDDNPFSGPAPPLVSSFSL